MLSFERGKPIAKVIEKESEDELNTIYLNNEVKMNNDMKINMTIFDPLKGLDKELFRTHKKNKRYLNPKQMAILRKAIRNDQEPEDLKLIGYYKNTKNSLENKLQRELFLDNDNNKIVPVPDIDTRECIYVSAPSGAGKSTYVADYAVQYKKLYPKNPIYMFSRVPKDKSIDSKVKVKRIMINENLVNNPIEPDELTNSLVIFDDIDTIPDKKQKLAVVKIRTDLLQTGRHEDVYVASTTHQISNYRETRELLAESRAVTFFPGSGDTYHIEYFLRKYTGMKKQEDINKIIGLPSRWVTIYKTYPMYILHEQGVMLMNNVQVAKTQLKYDPNVFNYQDALKKQDEIKKKYSRRKIQDSDSDDEEYYQY